MPEHPLDDIVRMTRSTIDSLGLMPHSARILVSVSGGPDSTCLLHVLRELGYALEVAHFDHQTRDGASADDAAFVEALAKEIDAPFHLGTAPTELLADASPKSFEETARDARYVFLVATALKTGCDAVATGHTADDQAETVLMRVLRGAGPRGLAGIPPIAERDGVRIVRPLIHVSRAAILSALDDAGIAYRVDESNMDTRFLRNRVRHELLPMLSEEHNANVSDALCRIAEMQRVENDLLMALTHTLLDDCLRADGSVDRTAFRAAHEALQRRAILEIAWARGAKPDFEGVQGAVQFMVEGAAGTRFDLGRGLLLENGPDATYVIDARGEEPDDRSVAIAVPGETTAFGKRIFVRMLKERPAQSWSDYCGPTRQVFDAACISGGVAVRHRRKGDRFAPLGMHGSKKLKDYFNDIGVAPSQRDRELLLTAKDEIVWVVGRAIDTHAAVTDATREVIEIEVREFAPEVMDETE
ncbi:MAG: tRNA lysidine(34) synthetase TilS [Candidatus Hydrogenedentes bacterium]|nr:tRNA lysidine(34) synthetase TilS [Candidatus Hydrogenedentota bacterium]